MNAHTFVFILRSSARWSLGMQRTADLTETPSVVRARDPEPMIYVASVHDYNSGRLVGRWFELREYSDVDDLYDHIATWLEDLSQRDGIKRDEWAVHDYEAVADLGEFPSRQLLQWYIEAIGDGVDLDALEKYVDAGGYPNDLRDRYVGRFESAEDFGVALLEMSGHLDAVPVHLRPYIDYEAYGRDAAMDSYFEVDGFFFLR